MIFVHVEVMMDNGADETGFRDWHMKLLYNVRIHTQNSSQPAASAIVIDRERILAAGETNDLFNQYPRAKGEDMRGRVLVPGLTDAHIHIKNYALALQKIDCEVNTKE